MAGRGLCRGYLNHSAMTAFKFVPHPHGQGVTLYRTGDLGARLTAGPIEYTGRLDHQVKIRGFRVEIAEIEAVFRSLPEVGEVVVTAHTDAAGHTRLTAFLVPVAGAALPVQPMHEHLGARVPDYMMPSTLVALDALPMLPNGKVDRQALSQLG